MTALGTMILHRFCGDEIYSLRHCELLADEQDDGIALTFEARTKPEPLQTLADTAELKAQPNAEVTVRLKSLDPTKLAGSRFTIPHGYDEQSEDWVGILYYYEHEGLDDNVVEILSRSEDRFRVRWTGVTQDVNYYDGSKPPTKVEIDGYFQFKHMTKWLGRSGE